MARILIAWELGAHFGHLARLAPVALDLREHGHDVLFAVRETWGAASILAPLGLPFVQAPLWHGRARIAHPPANYAELLVAEGYTDRAGLSGMLLGWQALFRLFAPQMLLADHAPTALLAANVAGIPNICLDSGFGIPPNQSPTPSFRTWEAIPVERLMASEQAVLKNVNALALPDKSRPYQAITEFFASSTVLLTTFPELDHYGARATARYVGGIYADIGGQANWPNHRRKKILAYLRPNVPGLPQLLNALGALDAECICAIPGLERIRRDLAEPLHIYPHPIRLAHLLREADLTVCHAGAGMICASLQAGVPLLLMPGNLEQHLLAGRVQALGAGSFLNPGLNGPDYRHAATAALETPALKNAARQFALRYRNVTPKQATAAVVHEIFKKLSFARADATPKSSAAFYLPKARN